MIIAAIIAKRNTGNQSLGCDMESPGRIDSFPQAPGTALHPDAPGTAGRALQYFSQITRDLSPEQFHQLLNIIKEIVAVMR